MVQEIQQQQVIQPQPQIIRYTTHQYQQAQQNHQQQFQPFPFQHPGPPVFIWCEQRPAMSPTTAYANGELWKT